MHWIIKYLAPMFHQPKKRLGQHFLQDKNIAERICDALIIPVCEDTGRGKERRAESGENERSEERKEESEKRPEANFSVLEVGPGLGVLTQFLYPLYKDKLFLVEIDNDLIPALKSNYPLIKDQIFEKDFLELDLGSIFKTPVAVIGNFPYNISSQILFKIVDDRRIVQIMVGMFQKEVAQRVVSLPGNKVYGLLSVWVQCFYNIEYLFTVNEGSFFPPPKVKSAVIRLIRKESEPECNTKLLLQIIKAAFNQRRKTLRNSLGEYKMHFEKIKDQELLSKRAETLGYEEYIMLAQVFDKFI